MASIRTIGDRVAVRRREEEEQKGRLVVPEAAKRASQLARVVAVGEDVKGVVVGDDVVILAEHAGDEVVVDGELLLVLHDSEILGVLEDDAVAF